MAVHAFAQAVLAIRRNEARLIVLGDEVVEVVVGLQNHAAAPSAVAATGAAFGHEGFPMERDTAFATVPRPCVNLDFVNKHAVNLRLMIYDLRFFKYVESSIINRKS